MKKIKLFETIKDIKNGVVKRKINKNKKNNKEFRYNVMEILKMVSLREKKKIWKIKRIRNRMWWGNGKWCRKDKNKK